MYQYDSNKLIYYIGLILFDYDSESLIIQLSLMAGSLQKSIQLFILYYISTKFKV